MPGRETEGSTWPTSAGSRPVKNDNPKRLGSAPPQTIKCPPRRHPAPKRVRLRFRQRVQRGIAAKQNRIHAAVSRRFVRQVSRARFGHLRCRGRALHSVRLSDAARPGAGVRGDASARLVHYAQLLPAEVSKRAGVAAEANQKQIVITDGIAGHGRSAVGRLIVRLGQNASVAALPSIGHLNRHSVATRINAARVDDKTLPSAPIDRNRTGEKRRRQCRVGSRPAGIGATRVAGSQRLNLARKRVQAWVMHRDRDRTPGSGTVMPGKAEGGGQRKAIGAGDTRPDQQTANGP